MIFTLVVLGLPALLFVMLIVAAVKGPVLTPPTYFAAWLVVTVVVVLIAFNRGVAETARSCSDDDCDLNGLGGLVFGWIALVGSLGCGALIQLVAAGIRSWVRRRGLGT